jgi:hypothetical protein
MIAWLWDAYGTYSGHGVTGTERQAVRDAEACMRDHGATAATLEAARFITGDTLTFEYDRIGKGRRASIDGNRIRWKRFGELIPV